jgi:type-F conjugative transfer system secretin TraK
MLRALLKLKNPLLSSTLTCAALFAYASSFAATTVDGADTRQIEVAISAKESNLLVVAGRRIDHVAARKGVLSHTPDQVAGVHHFIVQSDSPQTISMFVTDDKDTRYQLLLVPKPIPAQEIILRPSGQTSRATQSSDIAPIAASTMPYQRRVKSFLLSIADQLTADSLLTQRVNVVTPLWKEVKLNFVAQYRDGDLVGEFYELTNLTMEPMTLVEQELMRPGVLAILIEEHVIQPGASTPVYIVRARSTNER